MRASAPGKGASSLQVRAQSLRRAPVMAPANPAAAFALMGDDPAPAAGAPGKPRWRQADVKRALDAAEQAGLTCYRVEIAPDGTIAIVVGDPAASAP